MNVLGLPARRGQDPDRQLYAVQRIGAEAAGNRHLFAEFSYQLLQVRLSRCCSKSTASASKWGSDQWGNITSGAEFIRKNLGNTPFAMTTPLLTKADGSKFGKSTEGNIWLDPELTSLPVLPVLDQCDDADTPKFTRYFTLKSREEIEARRMNWYGNPQELKRLLARNLPSASTPKQPTTRCSK